MTDERGTQSERKMEEWPASRGIRNPKEQDLPQRRRGAEEGFTTKTPRSPREGGGAAVRSEE